MSHVPDIDIYHRQLRLNDLGKRVIVKSHNANVRWNVHFFFQQRINASNRNIIVCTNDCVWQWVLIQKFYRHAEAIDPSGFPQPYILIFQRNACALKRLLYTLQPKRRAKIIVLPADEGDFPVSL